LKAARGPPTCVAIGVSNSVAGYRTFGAAGKEAIGDGQLWTEPPPVLGQKSLEPSLTRASSFLYLRPNIPNPTKAIPAGIANPLPKGAASIEA
jgi:hypothetical protein